MPTPHGLDSEGTQTRIAFVLIEADLRARVVRFGPRKVGNSSLEMRLYPGVISHAPIQSFKDELSSKPISFVGLSKFTTLKSQVNYFASI